MITGIACAVSFILGFYVSYKWFTRRRKAKVVELDFTVNTPLSARVVDMEDPLERFNENS